MIKSAQAVVSAEKLIELGDADGACNRAYYAMFDAARAALIHAGKHVGKTHKGLINSFTEEFVKTDHATKEMGKALKKAETYRYVADYDSASVNLNDAAQLVSIAQDFVATIRSEFMIEPHGEQPPTG